MIQVYLPHNNNFNQNGDMTLFPSSCEHTAELGGSWTLELTHPIDQEGRWKYLVKEAVISVPTFVSDKQLFRVKEIEDKTDFDITVKAFPIFFDSADDHFLFDCRPTDKNGQEALNLMTAGSQYEASSNISKRSTAYFVRKNLMQAIDGKDSPTFIEKWGGEPIYDNFKIVLNERAGGDYGAEIRYGKNLESISLKEDMHEVVTRIVPIAFNGRMHSGKYIDSPLISKYAKKYIREIKFEDVKLAEDCSGSEKEDITICHDQVELDAALQSKCEELFNAGIDVFHLNMEIAMVNLENTTEYENFKDLVKVGLGDDVSCYDSKLDLFVKTRVIGLTWDCILNKIISVNLGDYEHDYFDAIRDKIDKVNEIIKPDGTIQAEKVKGILNAINVQLKCQKDIAHKQDVRAILFEDLDPDSELYGALAIGTQGFQISNKRTADGRDWDWTTAFTARGGYADAIVTGMISDRFGNNFWNLDTGELKISISSSVGDENIKDYINHSVNAAVGEVKDALTTIRGTVDGLQIEVQSTEKGLNDTTGRLNKTSYEFGTEDLKIVKSNTEINTHISGDGFKVLNGTDERLVADHTGVMAENLYAKTYLIVGNNSRLEDYKVNRTGCFWIG